MVHTKERKKISDSKDTEFFFMKHFDADTKYPHGIW